MANTVLQRIFQPIQRAIVNSSGAVTGLAGGSIIHKETVGTFTADGTNAVTVDDTNVGANSVIAISLKTVGGTVGAIPAIKTITPGTGFTVAATASDTSVYNYIIIGG